MRVAIFGASGYAGGELLRILLNHREVEIVAVTSKEHAGKPVHLVHHHLRGLLRLGFSSLEDAMRSDHDLAFLSLPHGVSAGVVPRLLEEGRRVIDLSADFRLRDPELYRRWYGWEHPAPELLERAVYGIPEFERERIRGAQLVAVPGCNATSTLLASVPLAKLGASYLIADLKVGSSEAGSKPSRGTHHPERSHAIRAYSPSGHRHQVEVMQELVEITGREVKVSMVPHSVGSVRGSYASVHSMLEVDEDVLIRELVRLYAGEPFVRIMPKGTYPDVRNVLGSNFADLGCSTGDSRASCFAAIDNLVKGASGQAVHCMNLMMGFDETEGLLIPPLRP
ncbi:MAG: N-acetyl-gamma-glutamyl-phosphate reductase [Candidatus Korarchaeum sp.]